MGKNFEQSHRDFLTSVKVPFTTFAHKVICESIALYHQDTRYSLERTVVDDSLKSADVKKERSPSVLFSGANSSKSTPPSPPERPVGTSDTTTKSSELVEVLPTEESSGLSLVPEGSETAAAAAEDTSSPPPEPSIENDAQSAVAATTALGNAGANDISVHPPIDITPSASSAAEGSTPVAEPNERCNTEGDTGFNEMNVPIDKATVPIEERPQDSLQMSQDLLQRMGIDTYATGASTVLTVARARGGVTDAAPAGPEAVSAQPDTAGSSSVSQAEQQKKKEPKSKR